MLLLILCLLLPVAMKSSRWTLLVWFSGNKTKSSWEVSTHQYVGLAKNLEVQRNFLHCNFLITFSKTQRLNLAWALESIQARAHYIQTVSLPFKPTWKKEEKAEVSVLQTAQHFWELAQRLCSKTSVASSFPTWNTLSLHIQKVFGEILWRTSGMEILAHNLKKNNSNRKLCKDLQQQNETHFRDDCIHGKQNV